MQTFWQDLRYGLRLLAKSPGFAAVAVLTLALGIGANTAIFSAVNGILLKPLPYVEPSQLVDLVGEKDFPGGMRATMGFSGEIWQKVRAQTPDIARLALWTRSTQTITGDKAPEFISAAQVSSDFFALLGVPPITGRPILPGDTRPGAKPIAVVSYTLWRSRWDGSNDVLNKTITLDGKEYAIVGVMPPEFTYPILTVQNHGQGVWLPRISSVGEKGTEETEGFPIARLKKGVSLEAANAQLKTITPRIPGAFTGWMSGGEFRATPLEKRFSDLDRALLLLLGAVGFVLLIACVNISGLLLTRGWARQRELAIREALGASRVRIVRQFLTESILLALAGGVLGLLFAAWGVHILRAITPANLPEHGHFDLNVNILWFTLALSLLAGILFGLAPALQASSRRVGAAIRNGFGSLAGTASRQPRRLRSALVVVEIALAVVLVIGATLVARSFEKLTSVRLGFRTDHIVTMDADFSKAICDNENPKTIDGCKATIADVVRHMRQIAGVQSAAVASSVPLMPWAVVIDLKIEGQLQEISLNSGATIATRTVSSDYFRTFGIPLLAGREFGAADVNGSQRVAIVDEEFARKYLGGNGLGQRISTDKDKNGNPEWMQVVGVVHSARDTNPKLPLGGEIYLPYAQVSYAPAANFIARTSEDPAVMIPVLRQVVWSANKNSPITDVHTMDQLVSDSVAEPRFQALLLGSFGGLGLILAMVGIYGVISYGVTQRTREIGVRMALGAQPQHVLRMIIHEGMLLAAVGIIAGIGGALALTRYLRSLLFDVKPTDALTFSAVALALLMVALLACYIPARRAMRVDPMVTLRHE
ncbi:MAG TPA: ABC transporter permease [Candidatus Acidoferrum sp.]|nr:ABC transporter permease [Candidatus Acidoferrum sp.]